MKIEKTLSTTFEIGKYIQTHFSSEFDEKKPWGNSEGHFEKGPNPCYNQTKSGLVLQANNNGTWEIDTYFGKWKILGSTCGDSQKVLETIREPLGLVSINQSNWAITKWNNEEIEMPTYKNKQEYLPYETVNAVWKVFSNKIKLN